MTETTASGQRRWVVLGIVMMGTFMAILDSSIVNVALPHMMSAFGVTRDDIEWVSTAFMLATAVASSSLPGSRPIDPGSGKIALQKGAASRCVRRHRS